MGHECDIVGDWLDGRAHIKAAAVVAIGVGEDLQRSAAPAAECMQADVDVMYWSRTVARSSRKRGYT